MKWTSAQTLILKCASMLILEVMENGHSFQMTSVSIWKMTMSFPPVSLCEWLVKSLLSLTRVSLTQLIHFPWIPSSLGELDSGVSFFWRNVNKPEKDTEYERPVGFAFLWIKRLHFLVPLRLLGGSDVRCYPACSLFGHVKVLGAPSGSVPKQPVI